jgi:uncharacterized membrane protein (DUF441 family)
MNFDLDFITNNAIVLVPIVIALTQAVKLTGWIQDHFSPLLAIGIGIIVSFLGDYKDLDLSTILLSGAIYGLIASGLYSGVKTTMIAHARMKEQKQQQKFLNNNKPKNNC